MADQPALPNRAARRALAQLAAPGPEGESRREYNALIQKAMAVGLRTRCECAASEVLRDLMAFIMESAARKEDAGAPGDDLTP